VRSNQVTSKSDSVTFINYQAEFGSVGHQLAISLSLPARLVVSSRRGRRSGHRLARQAVPAGSDIHSPQSGAIATKTAAVLRTNVSSTIANAEAERPTDIVGGLSATATVTSHGARAVRGSNTSELVGHLVVGRKMALQLCRLRFGHIS
jgi:hypothetical protein